MLKNINFLQERKHIHHTIIVSLNFSGGRRGGLIWTIFLGGGEVPFGALVGDMVDKGEGIAKNPSEFQIFNGWYFFDMF